MTHSLMFQANLDHTVVLSDPFEQATHVKKIVSKQRSCLYMPPLFGYYAVLELTSKQCSQG